MSRIHLALYFSHPLSLIRSGMAYLFRPWFIQKISFPQSRIIYSTACFCALKARFSPFLPCFIKTRINEWWSVSIFNEFLTEFLTKFLKLPCFAILKNQQKIHFLTNYRTNFDMHDLLNINWTRWGSFESRVNGSCWTKTQKSYV